MTDMPNSVVKPIPDPSTLTTDQLLREIDRVITLMEAKIQGGWAVRDVRFDAIENEFRMIESRRVEQKFDTSAAVSTAMSAADKAVVNALAAAEKAFRDQTANSEKAILKSETASMEQGKQQNAILTANIAAVSGVVSDLKERIGRIENMRQGSAEYRNTQRSDSGLLVAAGGFLVMLLSIGIAVFSAMSR